MAINSDAEAFSYLLFTNSKTSISLSENSKSSKSPFALISDPLVVFYISKYDLNIDGFEDVSIKIGSATGPNFQTWNEIFKKGIAYFLIETSSTKYNNFNNLVLDIDWSLEKNLIVLPILLICSSL